MDAEINNTWCCAAPVSSCTADLFANGVVPDSKAMVYHKYSPLYYQLNGSAVVTYYLLLGCFLYYAARGQGLLHDQLFTELAMTKTHVVALSLWLLATFGAVLSLAVMCAEWDDIDSVMPFSVTIHVCAATGLVFMGLVLWKEALLSTLGIGDSSGVDARSTKHVVFLPPPANKDIRMAHKNAQAAL